MALMQTENGEDTWEYLHVEYSDSRSNLARRVKHEIMPVVKSFDFAVSFDVSADKVSFHIFIFMPVFD